MAKKYSRTTERIIRICTLALLCAMQIVFARFLAIPIGTSLRFSLSFIPVVIAARHYGIIGGMLVYGLGDLIGAIALPTTGAYLPGFTVTAVISGLIFGIFLGKECTPFWSKIFPFDKKGITVIVLSVLSNQIICSLLLNSFWLSHYYSIPFMANLATRTLQVLIIGALQIIFMVLFLYRICAALKKAGI